MHVFPGVFLCGLIYQIYSSMRVRTSPPLDDVGATGLIVRFRSLLGRGSKYFSTLEHEETLKHDAAMIFPAWLTFQSDQGCEQPVPAFYVVN